MSTNSFITEIYKKEIKRKKIATAILAFLTLSISVACVAIILMLPSYFLLRFSKKDVERRLKAQEEILARRDLGALETKIGEINGLAYTFEKNETKRFSLAKILVALSADIPSSIKLSGLKLDPSSAGKYAIKLDGQAATRNDFLGYVTALKAREEIASVDSPISNLLKEQKVNFTLTVNIKPEYYFYEE
ncbi:hypothetical protein HYT01_01530 [Candidatus Giovannonibacteria bacterium]|nr:hypothetical protein [Candidatus Giovannonibacteria bacterium]